MKFIKNILILLILCSFSVFAQSIFSEDFEDYEISQNQEDLYFSNYETESDDVFDYNNVFLGYYTGDLGFRILIKNAYSGYYDSIDFVLATSIGSPQNYDIITDIFICETNINTLDSSLGFSQCSGNIETLQIDYPLSDLWGGIGVLGDNRTIYFNDRFYLDSTKKYILFFESESTASSNNYYRLKNDDDVISNYSKAIASNLTVQTYSILPEYKLYLSEWSSYNLYEQFGITCIQGDYPDCIYCNGGSCNDEALNEIQTEAGNQFLRTFTNEYSLGNYETINYNVLMSNAGATLSNNFTLSYKMRVNQIIWADIQHLAFDKRNFIAGLDVSNIAGSNDGYFAHIGGIDTSDYENFSYFRNGYRYTTAPYSFPENSNCDVNSGNWVDVTSHYTVNGGAVQNVKTYLNGVLCQDYNRTIASSIGAVYLRFRNEGVFSVDFDDIAVYEYFSSPDYDIEAEEILFCPYSNCIFYDDFSSYGDYGDITSGNWYFQPQAGLILDNKLYLNASETFPIIYNDDFRTNDYEEVISVVEFRLNNSPTPESFEDDYAVYEVQTLCNSLPIYSYKAVFIKDDSFSGSENRTVINLYSLLEGSPNILGTLVIDNSDYLVIKNNFDLKNGYAYLNVLRQVDIEEGFNPEFMFKQELAYPCESITETSIRRKKETNPQNFFIGINKIFYYGVIDETSESSYTYANASDELNISDALVKKEAGDYLHNTANSLGFRTTGTKLLFWFVIMMFFIWGVSTSKISTSAKTFGVIFAVAGGLVIGFYLKFIPLIVFVMFIFIIAILGAFMMANLFKSGE